MDNYTPITDMDELKAIEIRILSLFHAFAEEHGLNYYLAYGTLIGAVRHSGFIPWDDDIDIMMMRKDYDVFLQEFSRWADGKNLFLASPFQKEHFYPMELSKVCSANTIVVEPVIKHDAHLGVFIDVFPVDSLPNGRIKGKMVYRIGRILRRLIVAGNTNTKANEFKRLYSPFKRFTIRFLSVIPVKISFSLMDRLVHDVNNENSQEVMCYSSTFGTVFKREWFDEKVELAFEDKVFYGPKGYDPILRAIYGDYMQLPKKEEQIPHHVMNVWKK